MSCHTKLMQMWSFWKKFFSLCWTRKQTNKKKKKRAHNFWFSAIRFEAPKDKPNCVFCLCWICKPPPLALYLIRMIINFAWSKIYTTKINNEYMYIVHTCKRPWCEVCRAVKKEKKKMKRKEAGENKKTIDRRRSLSPFKLLSFNVRCRACRRRWQTDMNVGNGFICFSDPSRFPFEFRLF